MNDVNKLISKMLISCIIVPQQRARRAPHQTRKRTSQSQGTPWESQEIPSSRWEPMETGSLGVTWWCQVKCSGWGQRRRGGIGRCQIEENVTCWGKCGRGFFFFFFFGVFFFFFLISLFSTNVLERKLSWILWCYETKW